MVSRAPSTGLDKTLARVRLASWACTAGYLAYVVIAGIRAWPTMTWPEWWADLALEAGWNAAFWPYYFPRLFGLW
jgi:hypothetical protein